MRIFLISLALMLGSAFTQTTTAAQADRSSTAELPESPWKLGVALGLGIRTNPLALSDDIPVIINLDVGWFGKRCGNSGTVYLIPTLSAGFPRQTIAFIVSTISSAKC